MSNDANIGKFYQFLAKYEAKGVNWVDVADGDYGNDDGTVIKSEFRKFLTGEWNGNENGELTNDLINTFWKQIDTNTSASKISGTKLKNLNALDSTEVDNLDRKLDAFVELQRYIDGIQIPKGLGKTGSQWRAEIVDQLTQFVNNLGSVSDVETAIADKYKQIANKATAEYAAVEYQETLKKGALKDYPEYKVADDSTLQSIIANYVASVDIEASAEAIIEDIQSIINSYLATAELSEDDSVDLDEYGYDYGELNDLQKAVIAQTIKNHLKDKANDYKGFETEFNNAVQKFIDRLIEEGEGTDFTDLKAKAGEFATSQEKKNLDNVVTVKRKYSDIKADTSDAFFNTVKLKFGDTLANQIAKNDRYLDVYQEVINDVITRVGNGEFLTESGELDEAAVEAYLLEKIGENLEKFFTNGLGDLTLAELANTYNRLAEAAEAVQDTETAETQHKTAAIMYCDALVKRGNRLAEAVYEVFGNDYKSTIEGMLPGDIQDAMADLKAKATEIGDIKSFTLGEWAGANDFDLRVGEKKTLFVTNTVMNDSVPVDSNRITYQANTAGGTATIDPITGLLTVQAGQTSGRMTIKVSVLVDGVQVGDTKTITVTVKPAEQSVGTDTVDNTDTSKSDNNGWIEGTTNGDKNLEEAKASAKAKVEEYINALAKELIAKGYDKTIVNKAKDALISYYSAYIDAVIDVGSRDEAVTKTISYTNTNGQTVNKEISYYQITRDRANRLDSDNWKLGYGINLLENSMSNSSYTVIVNKEMLNDLFTQFINEQTEDTRVKPTYTQTIDEKNTDLFPNLSSTLSLNDTTTLNGGKVVSANTKSPAEALKAAYTTLAGEIDLLGTKLKNMTDKDGNQIYDSAQVDAAVTTLKNYYKAMLAQVEDPDDKAYRNGTSRNASFSYVDANGTTHQASAGYSHLAKDNVRDDHCVNNDSGITLIEGRGSNHGYRVEVNMDVVTQKLIEFFNSLAL